MHPYAIVLIAYGIEYVMTLSPPSERRVLYFSSAIYLIFFFCSNVYLPTGDLEREDDTSLIIIQSITIVELVQHIIVKV